MGLIDADSLIKEFEGNGQDIDTLDVIEIISRMESIKPVVLCGECKHFIRINEEGGECDLYHQSHWIKFYCADGEREDADREPVK